MDKLEEQIDQATMVVALAEGRLLAAAAAAVGKDAHCAKDDIMRPAEALGLARVRLGQLKRRWKKSQRSALSMGGRSLDFGI